MFPKRNRIDKEMFQLLLAVQFGLLGMDSSSSLYDAYTGNWSSLGNHILFVLFDVAVIGFLTSKWFKKHMM